MKTYEEIKALCDAKIPRDVIETRRGSGGMTLSYLTGQYIIDRLNEVFGVGYWAYTSNLSKDADVGLYTAQVRLVVSLGDKNTEFTDYGVGLPASSNVAAHETAIKAAITDGLKRAARCLGNSFGNGLYDKTGEGIEETSIQKNKNTNVANGISAASNGSAKSNSVARVSEKSSPALSPSAKQLALHKTAAVEKGVMTEDEWIQALAKRGVTTVEELNQEASTELLTKLKERLYGKGNSVGSEVQV